MPVSSPTHRSNHERAEVVLIRHDCPDGVYISGQIDPKAAANSVPFFEACLSITMQRNQEEALAVLDSWALNPTAGLPYELFLFVSRLVPMANVDLLIYDDEGRVLLTWRDEEIHGAGWHVPGGMIRYKETIEERICATALEELGAEVEFEDAPIVEQIIDPVRRARGHHLALVYKCRLLSPPNQAIQFTSGEPKRGQWAWHTHFPENMIVAHQCYRRFFV